MAVTYPLTIVLYASYRRSAIARFSSTMLFIFIRRVTYVVPIVRKKGNQRMEKEVRKMFVIRIQIFYLPRNYSNP